MKKFKGFTLIELLVSVSIIAILSSIAIYGLTSVRQKAQDTSVLSSLRDLQISLEAYKSVNGKYPDAGTQGTANYINNLAPTFISKLPVDKMQTATNGFQYSVSADKKTYCIYAKNIVFKADSQTSMYSSACPKTWTACKGKDVTSLTTCTGIVGS